MLVLKSSSPAIPFKSDDCAIISGIGEPFSINPANNVGGTKPVKFGHIANVPINIPSAAVVIFANKFSGIDLKFSQYPNVPKNIPSAPVVILSNRPPGKEVKPESTKVPTNIYGAPFV